MTATLVSANVDSLILGTTLQHPIHDERGVLLLAEGSEVTHELVALLKQRSATGEVQLHADDVDVVTFDDASIDLADVDSELAGEIDAIIEGGLLTFSNTGPAAREQMVFHGRRAYDSSHRENLILQHESTSESLDSMMKDALRGGVNGDQVVELAARHLSDVAADGDCIVSVATEARRQGLGQHALNVSLLAMSIAVEMGFNEDNVRTAGVAALVCDWGMIRVPEAIRNAESPLTQVEWLAVQKHPIHTLNVLERMPGVPRMVPMICYQTHESPNGRGYPRGRAGKMIHPLAHVVRVADVYKALVSERPHRQALIPYHAMECLLRMAKRGDVDQAAARALLNTVSLFPIGSVVALDDGSIAQVMRRNDEEFMQPYLELIRRSDGQKAERGADEYFTAAERGLSVKQALPKPGSGQIALTKEILG